eukprot:GCRY01001629.1.p1 GENE.GCRY01001629.1~~GCRY01001629.1.p1  ORF type:complete len:331 (+),score=58.65 GCRY01001629.1:155-1147(+)
MSKKFSEASLVVASDPEKQFIHLPKTGVELAYTVEDQTDGSNNLPPVVAIHGTPASLRDFRYLGNTLSQNRKFIRVDLPGHGDTRSEKVFLTFSEKADVLIEFFDALHLPKILLVAHSLGSATASHLLAKPEAEKYVDSAVYLAPVGVSPHDSWQAFGTNADTYRYLWRFFRFTISVPFVRTLALPFLKMAFVSAGFSRSTTTEEVENAIRSITSMEFPAYRPIVETIQTPVLVVYPEDDHHIKPCISCELAAVLPRGYEYALLCGGHNIQKTRALTLCKLLCTLTADNIDTLANTLFGVEKDGFIPLQEGGAEREGKRQSGPAMLPKEE